MLKKIWHNIKKVFPHCIIVIIIITIWLGIWVAMKRAKEDVPKYLLHNSAIVTAIEQIDEKWCLYSLSQKNEKDIGIVVFKMKSVCGLYQVPDELIFSKNYKNRGK